MKKQSVRLIACLLVFFAFTLNHDSRCYAADSQSISSVYSSENTGDDEWISMPAGAKPAYMGIHGGTMPVSLLVSNDGSSLFTFVGRTGNDFLEVLRNAKLPLPSLGNSTSGISSYTLKTRPELFAGNATASMPVFALSGDYLAHFSWFKQLQPFGLSEEPLRIEGQAAKPALFAPVRQYRDFFLPDYFQPRKKSKQ